MKRALIALVLALMASTLPGQTRVVLSLGHSEAARDATGHPVEKYAFTVGDDGRLLVWDLERRALWARYQISHRPVTQIVHHPTRNEVALVVNESVDRSSIRVVDWETGEELFRHDLEGTPVHLTYSPAGSYLVFTLPSFQSVHFLSADTGSPREYLDDGFGIVNFVQMGSSERNIMTYVPTRGEFIYWSLQQGEELQRVQTEARLSNLVLVDTVNRRDIAAAGNNELVIVDNVSGEIEARYPLSPIHDIRFDPARGRIMVLTDQSGHREVMSFTYENGRLRRVSFRPADLSPTAQFVVPLPDAANAILDGDETGVVTLHSDSTGRRTELGPRPTVPVVDAAFSEGRLHLSLGDHILTLVSDSLQANARNLTVSSVRQSVTALEEISGARLERVGPRIMVWGESGSPGSVFTLSPPATVVQPYYSDEAQNPVLQVRATDGGPIVVHRDGRIIQMSASLAVQRFQYIARGAQAATWGSEVGIVAAKTRASVFDSALIRVDQLTGETVPIRSDAFLTTAVTLGDRSTLFSIGLHGSPASASTRLVRFSGERYEQDTVLVEFSGEDPGADAMWDDQTGTLFTSIGYQGLISFDGRVQTPLDATGQIARELTLGGLFVAAVNSDGSLSLWERESGEFLVDIYVFEGDEWLAITAEGAFLSSSRRVETYLDFIPSGRTRLELDDFRIELPYRG